MFLAPIRFVQRGRIGGEKSANLAFPKGNASANKVFHILLFAPNGSDFSD